MGNSYYSSTFDDSLVNISSISTTWIPFPASSVCVLNTQGFNTGYQMWGQLKLVNQSTMSDIIPLQLKPNSPSDGDYVAPVQNFGLCPTPSAGLFAPLVISNFSKSGADTPPNANFIIIDSIYLYSPTLGVGSTPIALNYTCNIWPGGSVRFLVPAGVWANLTIGYHLYGNIDTSPIDRFWKSNNNGVVTTLANIINIPPFTTTDINIPPTSQGVIVFAQ